MGTRHLICIYHEGKFKLAKYCQFDGYPSGSGLSIVQYLTTTFNRDKLISGLSTLALADKPTMDGIWKYFDTHPEDQPDFPRIHPLLSRDTNGGDVYQCIQDSRPGATLYHQDEFMFGRNSLFCEWAYVLDLDTNTLEVYKGFQKTKPKIGHWAKVPKERGSEYYPIRLVATMVIEFDTHAMTQFMEDIEKEED